VRAAPPFTDIVVAARLILRDQKVVDGGKPRNHDFLGRVVLAVIDPKTLQSMQATNDACASNQVFSTNHPTPLTPATGG
jgi:hypothetical protein